MQVKLLDFFGLSMQIFGRKISLCPDSSTSACSSSSTSVSRYLIVLLVIIFFRGISLEYGDLIDPTETRYATIAQNMLISGDWITPRLPTETGLELYFSKPPLHFWLTTLAYKLFGIDEWTSRLPSFLGLLLILASVQLYANKFLNREIGYLAGIICVTSPLMFFLAGSSTIDVTFAGFTTAAVVAFALAVSQAENKQNFIIPGLAVFVFAALGFLTKGPAALILIGLPVFALCGFDRSLKSLTSLPWVRGSLLFLAISIPWFYLVEEANPGSVWYFFAHENFMRFAVKNYGGLYGAAHIRPYGSIWWMLALAIFPWSLYLLQDLYRKTQNYKKFKFSEVNRWHFFMLTWGLSPIFFFTIARSVLPAYTIPAIPGLSLYLACLLSPITVTLGSQASAVDKKTGFFERFLKIPYPCPAKLGAGLAALMIIGFFFAVPFIEVNRSASEILEVIANKTKHKRPIVGTLSTRNYSPYWTSGAFQEELSKPLDVVYTTEEEVQSGKYPNLVVKGDELEKLESQQNYIKVASRGKWHWYRRTR
ncbi:MAG: glycosyltransferase family 39 protein [Bdellovibrionota bacterium]